MPDSQLLDNNIIRRRRSCTGTQYVQNARQSRTRIDSWSLDGHQLAYGMSLASPIPPSSRPRCAHSKYVSNSTRSRGNRPFKPLTLHT